MVNWYGICVKTVRPDGAVEDQARTTNSKDAARNTKTAAIAKMLTIAATSFPVDLSSFWLYRNRKIDKCEIDLYNVSIDAIYGREG